MSIIKNHFSNTTFGNQIITNTSIIYYHEKSKIFSRGN